MVGAALLGFLWAWTKRQKAIDAIENQEREVRIKLETAKDDLKKSNAATKSTQLTLEQIQKENQKLENEQIQLQSDINVKEGELQVIRREKRLLEEELAELQEEMRNNIREISVIKEVPSYESSNGHNGNGNSNEEEFDAEKAKQLVKAFRKGVGETPDVNVT